VLVVNLVGWKSELFMIDRVVKTTQTALEAPTEGRAERERFLSYVEPFSHIVEHPSWVFAGAGRSSQRLARRGRLDGDVLIDERDRATHSVFSITYYCFGLAAAVCQVGFVIFGFAYLVKRVAIVTVPLASLVWKSLFASWCGLTVWWLFGHGIAGEPRGSMVYLLVLGLIFAARGIQDGLERHAEWERRCAASLEPSQRGRVAAIEGRLSPV
jgi:hypothetical protein